MRCIDCEHCCSKWLRCSLSNRWWVFGEYFSLEDMDIFQDSHCSFFKPIKVKIKIKKHLTNDK